jgi:hypothetical protein
MDKEQAIRIIKKTFQNPFNKESFTHFLRELLNKIDESKALEIRGNYVPESFRDYVKWYERIGTYTDPDEKKVDILVVHLQKESSIERARTAQRNFVARYLKQRGEKDAGLIAFVSPDPDDWRFSFVKMEYKLVEKPTGGLRAEEEFTPAKRYSFLVGKNESSHTAQKQLLPILHDDQKNPTLADIENAFSVEVVTKEFFQRYHGLYDKTEEALNRIAKKDRAVGRDFEEKGVDTVGFAKKLLGQIVFLYFLQKKGWFGVGKNENWGTGPKNFLRQLFDGKHGHYKNFFNDILEPLFYNALAIERPHDYSDRFNCKIPFLNGGLFDPINDYDWVHTDILLPNELFSNKSKSDPEGTGILDIFDLYNFTVKEDEPLEKEVAVDPEMLGKVFENLLEVKDRKAKGTYYTPREIVHYMCQQSLINYLTTGLKEKISKDAVEFLILHSERLIEDQKIAKDKLERDSGYKGDYKEQGCFKEIKQFANDIDRFLADIKVCDPAIGSGAFPVGMMTEIVKARIFLAETRCVEEFYTDPHGESVKRKTYNYKRDCIQNSLFGVDIDPSAVDIAKLRLWLSLIVDEEDREKIQPLPNLDYKIMQGNSLLEEYEGIKLFDEHFIEPANLDIESQISALKAKQSETQREYIQLHGNDKLTRAKETELKSELDRVDKEIKKLSKAKNDVKKDDAGLFDILSEAKRKADELKSLHQKFFGTFHKTEKDNLKKRIDALEWELIEATLKEQSKESALKELEKYKKANIKPFFLWKLHFADVFQEKGGFDVVIANPPYGETIKENKEVFKLKYVSTEGKFEIYKYFIERGLSLNCKNGTMCYITPDTWLSLGYFKKLRKIILTQYNLFLITESLYEVFEEATVDNIVFWISNRPKNDDEDLILLDSNFKTIETIKIIPSSNDEWILNLEEKPPIISKLDNNHRLMEYCEIWQGLIAYSEKDQPRIYSSKKKESDYHRKLLFGSDIGQYFIKWRGEYLKYGEWLHRPRPSYIFDNPKILVQRIRNPRLKQRIVAAYDDDGFINGTGLSNILLNADITNLSLEYILGVINSSLINFWFSYYYKDVNIKPDQLRKIPIIVPPESIRRTIEKIVKDMLKVTQSSDCFNNSAKESKVSEHKKQIDQLVYKLYGLSDNEIAIIETNQ